MFFKTLFNSCTEQKNADKVTCDTFEYWNYLPNELKQLIISKMEFHTRYKLSLCSKSDYPIVQETKLNIYEMKIEEFSKSVHLFVSYDRISRKSSHRDNLYLKTFEETKAEGNCYLKTGRYVMDDEGKVKLEWQEKPGVYKRDNFRMVALQIAGELLRRSNFKLTELNIKMNSPILQSMFSNSFKYITKFFVCSKNYEYVLWWISNLGPLEELAINYVVKRPIDMTELSENISSRICSYKLLTMFANSKLSEKQFLSLNSTRTNIIIDYRSKLTAGTINKFIKKWKNGVLIKEFDYLDVVFLDGYDEDELLEGLDAIEWMHAFRDEWPSFSGQWDKARKEKTYYQVLNNNEDMIATLRINRYYVGYKFTGILRKREYPIN